MGNIKNVSIDHLESTSKLFSCIRILCGIILWYNAAEFAGTCTAHSYDDSRSKWLVTLLISLCYSLPAKTLSTLISRKCSLWSATLLNVLYLAHWNHQKQLLIKSLLSNVWLICCLTFLVSSHLRMEITFFSYPRVYVTQSCQHTLHLHYMNESYFRWWLHFLKHLTNFIFQIHEK